VVTGSEEVLGVRTAGAVALVEPAAGWVDPARVTTLFLDLAIAAGAVVRAGTRVTAVTPARDGVEVQTDQGTVHAGRDVVLAVGAWAASPAFRAVGTAGIRTRSIQTALLRRPAGTRRHATFIDLRTGGYGKPVDEGTSLVGYPLLTWDPDPDANLSPDPAHQARTVDVVTKNLPWVRESAVLKTIRSVDAFGDNENALVATDLPRVWFCRPANGGGVKLAPELGREIARSLLDDGTYAA
jgi:glycine/D-amino acid oxidase-like deaminating enzyme